MKNRRDGMKRIKSGFRAGFTMAELLIVVAVVGVLIAVAIPVFASQLEKSRESTDLANVRSKYAELMSAVITGDDSFKNAEGNYTASVSLKQKTDGWTTHKNDYQTALEIAGCTYNNGGMVNLPGSMCTITYNPETEALLFDWGGDAAAGGLSGQNPYTAFVQNFNGKAVASQMDYIGSYCALENDPDSEKYNKFVSDLTEQLGIAKEGMYFDYNPSAGNGVHRLRYTAAKIELSSTSNWTYVPNDTVFTVVDMDKDGNILKLYTNTVSTNNKVQIGPKPGGDTARKAIWDHPNNYVLVYDSSDPNAVLPGY